MLRLCKYRACRLASTVALFLTAAGWQHSLCAQSRTDPPAAPEGVGSREFWVGTDAGSHNWLVYTGGTYAPGSDIHADGFRLRATTGYGGFSYNFNAATKVRVTKTYADFLVGYQFRIGELTAKAFAGWALLNQEFEVPALGLRTTKVDNGPKGAVELWLNLGPSAWTSLDANYADTRETWSVRSRIGYRVLPTVSLGVEGIFNHGDLAAEVERSTKVRFQGNTRIGGFARYEWFGGEISASGGLSGDWLDGGSGNGGTDLLHAPEVYGTVNWIVQF